MSQQIKKFPYFLLLLVLVVPLVIYSYFFEIAGLKIQAKVGADQENTVFIHSPSYARFYAVESKGIYNKSFYIYQDCTKSFEGSKLKQYSDNPSMSKWGLLKHFQMISFATGMFIFDLNIPDIKKFEELMTVISNCEIKDPETLSAIKSYYELTQG